MRTELVKIDWVLGLSFASTTKIKTNVMFVQSSVYLYMYWNVICLSVADYTQNVMQIKRLLRHTVGSGIWFAYMYAKLANNAKNVKIGIYL